MSEASLYLVTPVVGDADAIGPALERACAGGRVAAVLLRLAPGDERSLVNRIKALAPCVQAGGAALIVSGGEGLDLVTIAGRGGADGIHVPVSAELRPLRDRLKDGRILGVGGLRSRHEAMSAGEAGVDYLMFGEPRPDGSVPDAESVIERATWWAEIFATPCVAFAPGLDMAAEFAATGAEFVAIGEPAWTHAGGIDAAVEEVYARIRGSVAS